MAALDDGSRELRRALADPDFGGVVFKASITDGEDIIADILARLPVKSLMRFRCVCKPWRALIAAPHFGKKHLSYAESGIGDNTSRLLIPRERPQTLDYEAMQDLVIDRNKVCDFQFAIRDLDFPVTVPDSHHIKAGFTVMGSCNGLVCLSVDSVSGLMLWNPSTRQVSKVLPNPPSEFNAYGCLYGFGYDSTTDDYKIVIARSTANAHIFSLKWGFWKKVIGGFKTQNNSVFADPGIFFNGALHWPYERRSKVMSFKLDEEKFQEVPLPPQVPVITSLIVFRSCLCFVRLWSEPDYSSVWMMKEYGVAESWTQVVRFSIGTDPVSAFKALCVLENGVMFLENINNDNSRMVVANQTTSMAVSKTTVRCRPAIIYRETLVSPPT